MCRYVRVVRGNETLLGCVKGDGYGSLVTKLSSLMNTEYRELLRRVLATYRVSIPLHTIRPKGRARVDLVYPVCSILYALCLRLSYIVCPDHLIGLSCGFGRFVPATFPSLGTVLCTPYCHNGSEANPCFAYICTPLYRI